jgi:Mrp family chromosome partitioning ATPase
MSASFMRRHGARIADNGYAIVPIAAGQKFPGEFQNGRWWPLKGWELMAVTGTPEPLIDIWSNYPGCGVGITCGGKTGVIGIDIDILDADVSHEVRTLIEMRLGTTPLLRVGKAPKVLLVFRCAEKIDKLSYQPIEVLASGQQFVAYGVHPQTGLPYQWPEENPTDTPLDAIPLVTPAQVEAAVKEAFELIPEDMRPKRLQSSDSGQVGGQHVPSGGQTKATPEAIREALQHIPNPDLTWDDWKRVLMATFAASHGDEGSSFDFLDWSRKSTKHDDATARKQWTGCRASPPHSLGFGTLHHLAKQHGWMPSPSLVFNVDKDVSDVDISFMDSMPLETSTLSFTEQYAPTNGTVTAVMPITNEHFPTDKPSTQGQQELRLPSWVSQLEWEGRLDGAAPREYLVKKLLPRNGVALLSGPSGAGKSFIAIDLAGSLATGKPFFGFRTVRGGTLILAAEGYATVKERLLAYRKGKYVIDRTADYFWGVDQPYEEHFPIAVASIGALSHDNCDEVVSLAEGVSHMMISKFGTPLRLIIIDTFAAAFCLQDENSSVEVTKAMKMLQQLSESTNTLVMPVVHHGKTEGTGVRGSSAFEASADARLTVNYSKNEEGEVSWRRLSLGKSRTEETGWCHNFGLEPQPLGMDEDGEAVISCHVTDLGEPAARGPKVKPEQKANELLQAIVQVAKDPIAADHEGWISADLVKEEYFKTASGEKGCSDDALRKRWERAIKQAEDDGLVEVTGARQSRRVRKVRTPDDDPPK